MPKALAPRRPPREQVTAAILDAAVSLFATRGYDATTMQDVATQVGVTAPALYYYFDSKQRLLFEVIERNLQRFAADVEAALRSAPDTPVDQLTAFVVTHLHFQLEKLDRARVYNAMFLGTGALLDALTARQRAEIVALQHRTRDQLHRILTRGSTAGDFIVSDLTVTAMGILALGEFAAAWFDPTGRLEAGTVAKHYAELARRMVGIVGPGRSARRLRVSRS